MKKSAKIERKEQEKQNNIDIMQSEEQKMLQNSSEREAKKGKSFRRRVMALIILAGLLFIIFAVRLAGLQLF